MMERNKRYRRWKEEKKKTINKIAFFKDLMRRRQAATSICVEEKNEEKF
jgi:hypothetical protein